MQQQNQQKHLADAAFEAYEFGEGVTVVEDDNWDSNNPRDLTKIVYVTYDDDLEEAETHKISFHVRFAEDGSVEDVYGLDMESGNDIGRRGDLTVGQERQDIDVVDVGMLDEDHAAKFDKPWLCVEDDGTTHQFGTEEAACAFQREWRNKHGRDPITGKLPDGQQMIYCIDYQDIAGLVQWFQTAKERDDAQLETENILFNMLIPADADYLQIEHLVYNAARKKVFDSTLVWRVPGRVIESGATLCGDAGSDDIPFSGT